MQRCPWSSNCFYTNATMISALQSVLPDCWTSRHLLCKTAVTDIASGNLQGSVPECNTEERDHPCHWQQRSVELHQPPSAGAPIQCMCPEWDDISRQERHARNHRRAARAEPMEHQCPPLPPPHPAVSSHTEHNFSSHDVCPVSIPAHLPDSFLSTH